MKRAWALIILIFFPGCYALAGYQYNSTFGGRDYCITIRTEDGSVVNDQCRPLYVSEGALTRVGTGKDTIYLIRAGLASGGYTSATTQETTISVSYSLVGKRISSDPAFQSGTLADGTPGQVLTISITVIDGNGTFTLTPSRKHGFTSLVFEAIGDSVTLLYVDDTVGWILISQGSVQVN